MAARGQSVHAVAGMIPQRHLGCETFRVLAVVEMLADLRVRFHGLLQQFRFFGIEESAHHDVSIAVVRGPLLGRQYRSVQVIS